LQQTAGKLKKYLIFWKNGLHLQRQSFRITEPDKKRPRFIATAFFVSAIVGNVPE